MLVDASDSWLHIFNISPKAFFTTNIFDLFREVVENIDIQDFLKNSEASTIRHHEIGHTNKQWYESTFAPWFDEKENLVGTIIQTDDITALVEKELELERVNAILQAQSEVLKVGNWEYDIESEKLFWSEETKKIHHVPISYTPEVSEAIGFYKQGYYQNKISMLFHQVMTKGTPFSQKLIIVTATGEERWVQAAGKPILKDGKIIKVFGTFQDIHEKVMAETKTKENEQLLYTLINNIPLNIYVKNLDSKKILVNKAECEHMGKSSKELIGKSDFDLYDTEIAKISRDEDLEVIRTLKPILGKETISIKKNGETTNFLTSKIPLFNYDGNVNGLIGISMDITALKKKEDQLRNLINITSVQNKKLINFAHIVSHNLRSHSANFSMLLEFLINEKDETEKENIVKMLSQASDRLLETLDNLNEVVDINTNMDLEKKPLNLHESLTKVLQSLAALLDKNQVKIVNHVDKELCVSANSSYLNSIIINLITNAIKYRSPKRNPIITLNAQKHERQVVFSVSDNGLGIDMERYGGKIFGLYKTFHDNKDAKGLGLYIIRNQIEAMGGSITANSEVDKGTIFNVYFNEESQ
ncbi:PAS domain-containing sensor histidine kinase [Flagellimonas alvinocaridis]|uniref:histidine kinase n=2 Tax=Flagellimonas alvinocaridis TaxID=2530200 RepID=A0A4S8RNV7_9FLAO|nr:PAS domain-containing sensor histidine kinase [Allomuricauda alvinocaridis]